MDDGGLVRDNTDGLAMGLLHIRLRIQIDTADGTQDGTSVSMVQNGWYGGSAHQIQVQIGTGDGTTDTTVQDPVHLSTVQIDT